MLCSACHHETPDGARFCMHCAAPLAAPCGSCGAELPEGARFCPRCAHPAEAAAPAASASPPERSPRDYTPKHLADKILQSKSALEGERKQVTVLFADVKGSMELAEQVDPEDWHRILDRFFEILPRASTASRAPSTSTRATASWRCSARRSPTRTTRSAPATRRCTCARSCAATRRAARARGLDFSARIGLNSGEVVVGKIGDDLRMDYTAQGQTVGLAQRMEQLAAPDSCVRDGDTRSWSRATSSCETSATSP